MAAPINDPFLNKHYFSDVSGSTPETGAGSFGTIGAFVARPQGIASVTGQAPVTHLGGVAVPLPGAAGQAIPPPQVMPSEKHRATARIHSIEFSMLKQEDVTRLSHIQVVNKQMYEMGKQVPMPYGPLDKKLGTLCVVVVFLCVF